MSLRIGLAGLGVHGARYANHLLAGDVPGAKLTAVSRADADKGRAFAAEHGLSFIADPHELAASSTIDALILVLRPDLHAPVSEAALAAGKPVLVEKPMACDVASAERMVAAVEQSGVPLMVGQTLRFDAVVRALRERIEDLGPLRTVAINQRFEPSPRAWLDRPGPGGILLNTGVHGFDLIRFLSGAEPESIIAELGHHHTRDTDDQFAAVMRLQPGNLLATLDNTRATSGRSGRMEIVGERGQWVGDHIHRTLFRLDGRELENHGPVPPSPTIVEALRHFVDCVRRQTPFLVDARDGLATVRLVDAAQRSADRGERISL